MLRLVRRVADLTGISLLPVVIPRFPRTGVNLIDQDVRTGLGSSGCPQIYPMGEVPAVMSIQLPPTFFTHSPWPSPNRKFVPASPWLSHGWGQSPPSGPRLGKHPKDVLG